LRYLFEDYALDTDRRELRRGADLIPVTPQVFDLLAYVIRNRDIVVSKDDLIVAVWSGRIVSDSALTTRINAARSAIGDSGEQQRLIRTLPRKGIRFVGIVREEQKPVEAAATYLTTQWPRPLLALPDKPSIAVLSFSNMSGDPGQDYFTDGIVEDIVTALARFPSLFVIARNSSFTYKGRAVDIKQVGRELGVRYVLEGSVRKAGNRVRITAQLIQVETGAHVWAEQYDRDLEDIFALQDEMTASIVGALVPGLQRAEIERARGKPPENLDAYDLYLRALPRFYSMTHEGNDQALELLKRTLALDPNFVSALILAENCWALRFGHGWSPVEEALAESMRYARLAVQLDPDNAEALAALARRTALIQRKFEESMSLAERAVAANPNCAYAWQYGGWAFIHSGVPETALAYFERALRLSPRDPRANDSWNGMALALIQLRRDHEAVGAARKAVQHNSNSAPAWRALASALALAGYLDEAKSAVQRVLELDPTCSLTSMNIRFGYTEKGRKRFYRGLLQAGMPE
jgi:TolB-like protein